jgi:predicted TIM-barrel fold metal-dependent hydrolase
VGIKIYPAFGFDPRPRKAAQGKFLIFSEDKGKEKDVQSYIGTNLEQMYEFAQAKNLPITTHCSPGGTWLCGIEKKEKHKYVYEYTQPYNFKEIALKYEVRINFAHMGGQVHSKQDEKIATIWYKNILELILDAHNRELKGRFYTDKSNGIAGLISKKSKKKRILETHIQDIQKRLNYSDIGEYFIFGSDWPLHTSYLNLKEYVEAYVKDRLTAVQQKKYFSENIAKFLFGEDKKIPENYIKFLKRMNNNKLEDRDWIELKDNEYYLKTEED